MTTPYDTLVNADLYFAERLHVLDWTQSSDDDKNKALIEATRRIDRLRFHGYKVSDAQELEFPRYYGEAAEGDEEIPDDIKIACFEIAYSLLSGNDPEKELKNLSVVRRTFSSVTTVYKENDAVPEYIAAGIPSFLAWSYLKPFLAYCKSINMYRKI